jgi:hypothetical protein
VVGGKLIIWIMVGLDAGGGIIDGSAGGGDPI